MNKKYKSLAKSTAIFAIGIMGSRVIAFFLVPLYTNMLTPAEYGISDFVVTFSNIVVPIFSIVIQDSILRFGLSKEYQQNAVIKNAVIVLLISAVTMLSIFPLLYFYKSMRKWRLYLYLISAADMTNLAVFSYARVKEKNVLYAIGGIINTLILAILSVLLLVVFPMGVKGYLLSYFAGFGISALVVFFGTNAPKDIKTAKYDGSLMKKMVCYSAPLIVNNLSWWILNSSDRVMVDFFCSDSDLGLYATASRIPALLNTVTLIFSQAWTVSAIKDYENEQDKQFFERVFRLLYVTMSLGCSIILLILKPFMSIYVGKEFYESWHIAPFLLLGILFFSYGNFFGAIYAALKKNIRATFTTFGAATVNIIINLLLLPKIGVIAAAVSTAVGYGLNGIYRMFDSQKMFRFKIEYVRFFINTLIIIIQAVLVFFEISTYLVSAVAVVFLVLYNHKEIKDLVSAFKHLIIKKVKNKESF